MFNLTAKILRYKIITQVWHSTFFRLKPTDGPMIGSNPSVSHLKIK